METDPPQTMEIDMDIDLGAPDPAELAQIDIVTDPDSVSKDVNTSGAIMDGQADGAQETVPHKVHIRGLDEMSTADIKRYASGHFSGAEPERVEWIDDTSANLIYEDREIALAAIQSLIQTADQLAPNQVVLIPIPAKPVSDRSDVRLSVRTAFATDQKRPRAYESSRYYLMNPDQDPREQRRRRDPRRRDDRGRGKRDGFDHFDVSMYDDDGGAAAAAKDSRDERHRPSSRRRSRSPDSYRPRALHRDRSDSGGDRRLQNNKGKELFPARDSQEESKLDKRQSAKSMKIDLFPNKGRTSLHHRSHAFDAADETADLFAGKMAVTARSADDNTMFSLADRISKPASSLEDRISKPSATRSNGNGGAEDLLGVRGASTRGFAIKGGASHQGTIRELFPQKANANKELFAEKLEGRNSTRRVKAVDLFQ